MGARGIGLTACFWIVQKGNYWDGGGEREGVRHTEREQLGSSG